MSRPAETLADYVLGALSPDERAELETHLSTCSACRQLVRELQETRYTLPDALPKVAPPEGAWAALQARREVGVEIVRPGHTARPWLTAAALAALLLSSLFWGLNQSRTAARLQDDQQMLAAWMNHPDLAILPLSPVVEAFPGVLCTYPDGRALLVQKDAPPRGKVYRVWGRTSDTYVYLGATDSPLLRFDSRRYRAIEVSLEGVTAAPATRPTTVIGRVSLL